VRAYWEVASDGGVFSFGGAPYYGSTGSLVLKKPVVGMAGTPGGGGYWLVASDGGIFSFGNAPFDGSTGAMVLNRPVVAMGVTPSGGGYWLAATDGGIFAFGNAGFHGSTGSIHLNKPIVGMAPTPNGGGYWEVASDGGIFAFGDAGFYGSMGGTKLNQPIVGMIASADGAGYMLVASDGGTFSFGDAPFYGSLGGIPLKRPVAAAAVTPGDTGYWFADTGGEVSAFGEASYYGSAPTPLHAPIVGMAEAPGTGAFAGEPYPSGEYGYDISTYQCSNLPTGLHDIGIVEVDGVSSGATNPCLASEGAWAGAGLNLYTFLTNVPVAGLGAVTTPCASTSDCFNVGYNAGIQAFDDAQAAGLNTTVAWWLDVEGASANWTSNPAFNAQTVMGAIAALRNTEGIASVGVYASPEVWNNIVGNYQPAVPYWMADWLPSPSGTGSCADAPNWQGSEQLPTGPVEIVQYSDQVNAGGAFGGFDGDYAC
jgi:hypothetical protein